jgi:hypothetical protein
LTGKALLSDMAAGISIAQKTKGKKTEWTTSRWVTYTVYGLVLILGAVFFTSVLPPFRPYPYADEWTYRLPFSFTSVTQYLQWAFAQHVDHRIPIQKFLQFSILKASGFDFRYLVGFNFLLACLLCAMLIGAARMYRGYQSIGDLIIPLTGLCFGAGFTLWGFQFQFLSSTLFVVSFLFLAIVYDRHKNTYQLNAALLCLALCSWCGINGMVMSSALSAALAGYFIHERLKGQPIHPLSTYCLLVLCIGLNIILWRCWIPSAASDLHHFAPLELATFVYGLLPSSLVVYSFTDTWWKSALVLALVLSAAWIVSSKIWRGNLTFADFALASTLAATLFLVFSISSGRAKGDGGWNSVLAMHYGYLTIFLPLVSWLLISSQLSIKWSNLLGILLVVVFARAFQINAVWRYGVITAALPHQSELQQLGADKDLPALVSKYVLDFTWKDQPNYKREVLEGISTFQKKGFKMYGQPPAQSASRGP